MFILFPREQNNKKIKGFGLSYLMTRIDELDPCIRMKNIFRKAEVPIVQTDGGKLGS